MAQALREYSSLQDQLVKPSPRRQDAGSSALLRVEIPVCVTMSNEPEERWNFVCMCLRWIASDTTTIPMKQGAILSILSVHTENMRAHAALAARAADASLVFLEVDSVSLPDGTLRFNARSGITEQRADRLRRQAVDLAAVYPNRNPFLDPHIETEVPTDMAELLDYIYSIAVQIWVAVIKSMTAPETAAESENKRLAKYQQQGRLNRRLTIHPALRAEIQRVIRGSLVLRHFMIAEIKRANGMGDNTTRYYAMVGDVSGYVKNAGLTAFFLTLRFGLGTKYPALAMSALAGDLRKISSLIRVYKMKGENAPYMAFLEDPDMGNFAPSNYSLLYSYAMGVGNVLEASVTRYQFAREFLNDNYYRVGVRSAQQQQGALDEDMAKEMQLTEEARRQVRELVSNLEGDELPLPANAGPRFMNDGGNNNPNGQADQLPQGDDNDDMPPLERDDDDPNLGI
ncbi:NP protein [avian paramyxovirus 11]|uniref:Nucleocapsid n=1 Tax=avian paramyxovirus 11 TaxID=2560310 RepID=I6V323_9MONO|nr:NP protein [Avian paramyxovirus 11]AFN06855.1 NP protein [Avian paramyxovirus 11]